ncbi:MAG: hypothetical protein LQ339_006752 [Xanthoria mediterranea]|nr:MAG: hypothetical protein LQ339_006752 [Xanthoria mediterranea]
MRLLSVLPSLIVAIVVAFLGTMATADLVDNCQGSNMLQEWSHCDEAIASIDDNQVYNAPHSFSKGFCAVEYKCYAGRMIGKNTALGDRNEMTKTHYILGYSLRETAEIIKTMCVDRNRSNRIEGTYATGNELNCALTINPMQGSGYD